MRRKPHDVPVGIVGPSAVIEATATQLERSAPGAFDVTPHSSSAAAKTAILHRSVYGAFEPGSRPTLLVATAASGAAAALLEDVQEGGESRRGRRRSFATSHPRRRRTPAARPRTPPSSA
ncbi:MAG TPA: hypothetical protein VE997_06140 [Candidatus Limnocylindria bacterium]|jgi:hypothetical protein|nr:hypothetical protein [Candidatus Limnocylindria bacterium]